MKKWIKDNFNKIIGIFIIIQPILDLLTGLNLHVLKFNLTIGIVVRMIFLLFIIYSSIFIYKKKGIIPYLILFIIYSLLYVYGIYLYKDGVGLFREIQGLIKVFYFPILFISLYEVREEVRISKMTLFVTMFLYLILIFVPLLFGFGYKTYQITKVGTLGFFNSANEVGGIISILTPIMFIILNSSSKKYLKLLLFIMYLVVILMMGTKTPFLILVITLGFHFIYLFYKGIKEKAWKKLITFLVLILIGISSLVLLIPKTNFYKNIETHLDYLEVDDVLDVFEDEELVDHFIFSQRLTFLHKKAFLYNHSSLYQKIIGIGYLRRGKDFKMIEMDYFDIFYSHGFIGFILFFFPAIFLVLKLLEKPPKMTYERYMTYVSFLFIIILSFFTGHIITAPAVSFLVVIIILSLGKRKKKNILFITDKNNTQLIKKFSPDKYQITILKDIDKKSNIYYLWFKIFNYYNYDISIDCGKFNNLVLIAAKDSCIYLDSYKNKDDFDNINLNYKYIIFSSTDIENKIVKDYPLFKKKEIKIEDLLTK